MPSACYGTRSVPATDHVDAASRHSIINCDGDSKIIRRLRLALGAVAGRVWARYVSNRAGVWCLIACLGMFCGAAMAAPAGPKEAKPPKRIGYAVHVTLPINGERYDRTETYVRRAIERAEEQRARLVLVFELKVPADQAKAASESEFGAALSLAEFLASDALNGVRTVAWIPQPIEGHAVLVALACDEIIMAKDASLGKAGIGEKVITEARRTNYREIANNRKTIPAPVAMWLLDDTQEVLVVETEVGTEFIAPSELDALKKRHALKSPPKKLHDRERPGQSLTAVSGRFTGEEARQLGFVSYLAETPKEVAKALDLPPDALDNEDPSLGGNWKAVRVDLKGPINDDTAAKIKQMIDRRVQQDDIDFICLWVDSPGGSLEESLSLANYLAAFEQTKVRTVAYIPSEARSDAAVVALACQQVVMGPRAVIGGPGAQEFSPEQIRQAVVAISDRDGGPWRQRHWSPVAAMIDPKLTVYRCTRDGETAYLSDREIEELERQQPEAPKWRKHEAITLGGQPLQLSGERAKELGLIYQTAESFADFKQALSPGRPELARARLGDRADRRAGPPRRGGLAADDRLCRPVHRVAHAGPGHRRVRGHGLLRHVLLEPISWAARRTGSRPCCSSSASAACFWKSSCSPASASSASAAGC